MARVASTSLGNTGHAGAYGATDIVVLSTEELYSQTAITVVADVANGMLWRLERLRSGAKCIGRGRRPHIEPRSSALLAV